MVARRALQLRRHLGRHRARHRRANGRLARLRARGAELQGREPKLRQGRRARGDRARVGQRREGRRRPDHDAPLGFPQGTTTALFIVALLSLGFLPGPEMVRKNADVIFSIVWIQGIAGILGTLVGFILANHLAKLAQVRYSVMVPVIFVFLLMGALSATRDPLDLVVLVGFGLLGYAMKRLGYPRPPLILGLVLGDLMERYLYRSVASYGYTWLYRPAVIVLAVLAVGTLAQTLWSRRARSDKKTDAPPAKAGGFRLKPQFFLTLFFFALFVGAL